LSYDNRCESIQEEGGLVLSSIATQELAPYLRDGKPRVRIDGPALVLEPKTAQAIAVALHELASNAAKYGALSVAKGRVEVTWSLAANDKLIDREAGAGSQEAYP
jgi:two-component sensor histidine kinase